MEKKGRLASSKILGFVLFILGGVMILNAQFTILGAVVGVGNLSQQHSFFISLGLAVLGIILFFFDFNFKSLLHPKNSKVRKKIKKSIPGGMTLNDLDSKLDELDSMNSRNKK